MKSVYKILLVIVFVELVYLKSYAAAAEAEAEVDEETGGCPTPHPTCDNLGVYNTSSCSCSCFPGYSGASCQYVDCTLQSSQCGKLYTKDMCHFRTVYEYCPQMCDNPICTCGFETCLNNGTFNATTCSCTCPVGFYGSTCESTSPTVSLVCPTYVQRTCQNGARFNRTLCKCDCNFNFIKISKILVEEFKQKMNSLIIN